MTTTVARLLAQKQEMLARLERNLGDNERAEIESILAKIDTALSYLDDTGRSDPT